MWRRWVEEGRRLRLCAGVDFRRTERRPSVPEGLFILAGLASAPGKGGPLFPVPEGQIILAGLALAPGTCRPRDLVTE